MKKTHAHFYRAHIGATFAGFAPAAPSRKAKKAAQTSTPPLDKVAARAYALLCSP